MNEKKLIKDAQRGRVEAFNDLVLAYQDRVYNLAYRILGDPVKADDATQESFISVYQSLSRFRGGSFESYVLRIVTNKCYDMLRKQRQPSTPVPIDDLMDIDNDANALFVDEGSDPALYSERREIRQLIQAGINTLPVEQRITLVLVDVWGLDYRSVSDVMGSPVGTVRSRLARARGKLRGYLRQKGELLPLEFRL